MGLIAQETEKVIPEIVHTDKEGYKSIEYAKLVALLIEAMKQMDIEKELLEQKVKALETNSDNIKKQVEMLNASIEKLYLLIQKEEAKK